MHVMIQFECDNEDIPYVLGQLPRKIEAQLDRPPGCVCTHPEAADQLRTVVGRECGTLVVSEEAVDVVQLTAERDALRVNLEAVELQVRLKTLEYTTRIDRLEEQIRDIVNRLPATIRPGG